MTAKAHVKRLIEDINNSIEIRGRVRGVERQIREALVNDDMHEFVSALNVGEFDLHLDILAQFVNKGLFTYQRGDKLDIHIFLNDLKINEEKIVERVQYILDDNLISANGSSVSKLLVEQFEWLHRYSN
jgi:hypothetical protein